MTAEQPRFKLSPVELDMVADAAARATEWHELSRTVQGLAATRSSKALELVAMGFVYLLREADHGRGRAPEREVYDLMLETREGTFPPRPSEVLEPVRALWRQVADAIDDPVVRGRLLDLFFVADGPRAYADGRSAAEALEELAGRPSWSVLDRALCMARALDIGRELNDLY